MFTTIVMIMVIVWAFREIAKDLGLKERIQNAGKKGQVEENK